MSDAFSDQMEIPSQGHSLLVKAKRLGRWWLLKGLKTEYRDQTVYRIFLRKEFELLSGLQHSGIVQAVDFKDVAGVGPCIVMEWIDGVTLKEWLHESHTKAERRAVADVRAALRRRDNLPLFALLLCEVLAVVAMMWGLNRRQQSGIDHLSAVADSLEQQLTDTKRLAQFQQGGTTLSADEHVDAYSVVFRNVKYTYENDIMIVTNQDNPQLLNQIIIADSVVYHGRMLPVAHIRWHAFYGGRGDVSKVFIPRTVTNIDDGAFDGLAGYSAEQFIVAADNPVYCSVDGVIFTKDMRELVRYSGGNGRTTYAVPPSVRVIHGSAFASAHYRSASLWATPCNSLVHGPSPSVAN